MFKGAFFLVLTFFIALLALLISLWAVFEGRMEKRITYVTEKAAIIPTITVTPTLLPTATPSAFIKKLPVKVTLSPTITQAEK